MKIKLKWLVFFSLLVVLSVIGAFMPRSNFEVNDPKVVVGDVAWMLCATALVLLMTPGLSFFYGGMVRTKNVVSTILQSFIAMGVISITWVVIGFSLAFGDSINIAGPGTGIIGNPFTYFMFRNVGSATNPALAQQSPCFCSFQMKFAIITLLYHRFICRAG